MPDGEDWTGQPAATRNQGDDLRPEETAYAFAVNKAGAVAWGFRPRATCRGTACACRGCPATAIATLSSLTAVSVHAFGPAVAFLPPIVFLAGTRSSNITHVKTKDTEKSDGAPNRQHIAVDDVEAAFLDCAQDLDKNAREKRRPDNIRRFNREGARLTFVVITINPGRVSLNKNQLREASEHGQEGPSGAGGGGGDRERE